MCVTKPTSPEGIESGKTFHLHANLPTQKAEMPCNTGKMVREANVLEFGEDLPEDHSCTGQVTRTEAVNILSSGRPGVSMDIPLAPGEELPPCIFTLLQGTIWALLVEAGANPDLEDTVLDDARMKWPGKTTMHDKIRKALAPEAKCLWFLCRKFFFSLNVAEKDGEKYQHTGHYNSYYHRMYMGRLFMLDTRHHTTLTRARMPRALEVYSHEFDGHLAHIARTPKGMWGWGYNEYGQLGFKSSGFVDPTRLTFPACPKVAELEASLPPWEKHRVVTGVSLCFGGTFILTPLGVVMSGYESWHFVGSVGKSASLFRLVIVPDHFVPQYVMAACSTVILSSGDRQMICGRNWNGQLGLGHNDEMCGFQELPFGVDLMLGHGNSWNIFLADSRLLFSGWVPEHIAQSGLLPGYQQGEKCLTATPLQFSSHVSGFFSNERMVVWISNGATHVTDSDRVPVSLDIVTTAVAWHDRCIGSREPCSSYIHDSAGRWRGLKKDGKELIECGRPPPCTAEVTPVDVYEQDQRMVRTDCPLRLDYLTNYMNSIPRFCNVSVARHHDDTLPFTHPFDTLPNIVLSPHRAWLPMADSMTQEWYFEPIAQNILRIAQGRDDLVSLVDVNKGY
ncbi:hypothetical protein J8273_3598 [Carpediemonas membranifera]|uniref:Uncharacterized protein n=1 Tax=Carpediemonas membranifera TaxID=201153 RepID=A0A8J6DZD1_9EUKA|nr:hypothetical protein J8273_3598 [Carpediemonas membranifera]|eukprot:KAG9393459.1 hypothetical protein J8273_3598 [Carpediemonas membranifera]